MQPPAPNTLILHNRAALSLGQQRLGLWFVVFGLLIVVGLLVVIVYFGSISGDKPIDWGALAERLLGKLGEDWMELVLIGIGLGASLLQLWYLAIAQRRERLVLNDAGIRYVSPLPSALQFLRPSWSLPWGQIRRIAFKRSAVATRPEFVTLIFDSGRQKRTLRPYLWVDPKVFQAPSWREHFKLVRPQADSALIAVMDTPLMRYMQGLAHVKLELPDASGIGPFALEKSPAVLAFVGVFFVSMVYAFADAMIVNSETYVEEPFYGVYVAGGIALCALAVYVMRRANVPLAETLAVALLAGIAFGVALYPGLLRVNQLTDTGGLKSHEYRMLEPAHFVAVQDSLPDLRFPDRHREFWSRTAQRGAIERFKLRRGGLDFYQIDMAPIFERIRAHYEGGEPNRQSPTTAKGSR